jgi:hypothetical protein
LYGVSRCDGCDKYAGRVGCLDREEDYAAARSKDSRTREKASGAEGAKEVNRQINRDGAVAGLKEGVDGAGGGRVEQGDDGPAVEYAAHAFEVFANVHSEGGRAALGSDELKAEQSRVWNQREDFAQALKLFRGNL